MTLLDVRSDRANDSVTKLITDADYAAVKLYEGYSDGLLTFAYASCIISMVIGIPGNIITIVALAKYKRVHNATAMFIMNLSCSDLIFCCLTPPLAASTFGRRSWVHGKTLCFLYPPVRYILSVVSILSIVAITINRYIIIVHPTVYRKIYQNRNVALMLVAIWIAPMILLIPTCLGKWGRFDLDKDNGSCSIVEVNNSSAKKILFIAVFGIPSIVIIFCYARIFFIVRRATRKSKSSSSNAPHQLSAEDSSPEDSSSTVRTTTDNSDTNKEKGKVIPLKVFTKFKPDGSTQITEVSTNGTPETSEDESEDVPKSIKRQETVLKRSMGLFKILLPTRKDKRLGTMILAIMTAFCLCHFPIVLAKVMSKVITHPAVNITSHILFYLSSCINPVIYVVMSKEYKKAYKNLFRGCSSKRKLIKKKFDQFS